MKKISIVFAVLIFLLSGCGNSNKDSEELERLKQEYAVLQEEIDRLKQQQAQQTEELESIIVDATNDDVTQNNMPTAPSSGNDSFEVAASSDFTYVSNGSEVQIDGYLGNGGVVVIPDKIDGVPVTRIAPKAFDGATNITGLVLPEYLTFIGDSAFKYLENLGGVLVIPETVIDIEGHAFQCTGITGVVIKSSCEVNVNAFANNSKLKFVYVKEGCNPNIKNAVFGYSEAMETAIFPDSMCSIKDETFNLCNSMVIYTPDGSYSQEYANRNFIRVNTTDYNKMADEFAATYSIAATGKVASSTTALAYDAAINMTMADLDKRVNEWGTSYYYHGIIINEDDMVSNGAVNQGAMYRSVAKYLAGYTMQLNGGNSYGELMTGIPYTTKDAFAPYAENALSFIVQKDSLYYIMKKFESMESVQGTFDFSLANFNITIGSVSDCASEMMISEEMLGYVIAAVSEYTPEIYFTDGGCTINLQANAKFDWPIN